MKELVIIALLWSNFVAIPKYDRKEWRHWTDEDKDGQDTRQEVLIAESLLPVIFHPNKPNRVIAGLWHDDYSGQLHINPKELDVDHCIPLGEAHASGGWAWSKEKKRAYANDMSNPNHLIAVSSRLNRQKGKKDPADWWPPCDENKCEYAINWRFIKAIWGMTIDEAEERGLIRLEQHCPY